MSPRDLRLLCVTFWTIPPRRTGPVLGVIEVLGDGTADLEPCDQFMAPHEGWPWLIEPDGALSDLHDLACYHGPRPREGGGRR